MPYSSRILLALIVLTLGAGLSEVSSPPGTDDAHQIRGALAEISKTARSLLRSRPVEVLPCRGPRSTQAFAGGELRQHLRRALQRAGVKLVKQGSDAQVAAQLEYSFPPTEKQRDRAMKFSLRLIDNETGDILDEIQRKLVFPSDEEAAILIGATSQLVTRVSQKAGEEQIFVGRPEAAPTLTQLRREALLSKKAPYLQGSKVKVSRNGLFAIEIFRGHRRGKELRMSQLTPGQPVLQGRFAFVPVERGEVYAIRLHNFSEFEAAASVAIDGVNVMEFHEDRIMQGARKGEPAVRHLLVPPKGQHDIMGWLHSDSRAYGFKVTDFENGAARNIGREPDADTGSITAVFRYCWEKSKPLPLSAGEPGIARSSATGFGDPVEVNYTKVGRELGVVRESISLRYANAKD